MSNKFIRYYAITVSLLMVLGGILLYRSLPGISYTAVAEDPTIWNIPDINSLPRTPENALIRYGKELIINTARYLGPKGSVAVMSNGMNCENCHLEAGTRLNGNCFAMVASTYPKYRDRSGKLESVEFRVNDCMERSLNGKKLDSLSKEMQAMVAYLKWLGAKVPKNVKLKGMGITVLSFPDKAASIDNGKQVYVLKCHSCHGDNGEGLLKPDSTGYIYPPLWGSHSYNVSAGIYLISRLAGYVKYNMPFTEFQGAPQLSDDEAWDVAAFVNSQPRPEKYFKTDWPVIATKPFDYPFGPYADSFSVAQHKYGPYAAIKKNKK